MALKRNLRKRNAKMTGYTIVEVVIASAILILGLLAILQTYQVGLAQLSSYKLKGQVAECARLTMEYLTTIPGDTAYKLAPGTPSAKSYYNVANAGLGITGYVTDAMPVCSDLSANAVIKLQYELCNGCVRYLSAASLAADPTGAGTRCEYDLGLQVSWKDPRMASSPIKPYRYLTYRTKQYSNSTGQCIDAGACGMGTDPETVVKCTFVP